MCSGNHSDPGIMSMATPELGVRLLTHWKELDLTDEQLRRAIELCRNLSDRYGGLAADIIRLGVEIDIELCKHHVDRETVNAKASQRRVLVHQLEDEFFDCWVQHHSIMTEEQYKTFFDIYRAQFSDLRHPVFGTTEYEQFERTMSRVGGDAVLTPSVLA